MKKLLLVTSLVTWFISVAIAAPLGTAFTYQGRLSDGGQPAQGVLDLSFTLYDAASGGSSVGLSCKTNGLALTDGLFTVTVDFGPDAFDGSPRWLEIGVRTNGSVGGFTALAPRQALTATPHAILATKALSLPAAGLTGEVPGASLPADLSRTNHTHFGQQWEGASGWGGLGVWNDASNTGYGLLGVVIDRYAAGVKGINTNGVGVCGISIAGAAVVGQSDASSGSFFVGQTGQGDRRFRVTTDGQVIANGGYLGDGAGLSNVTATALSPTAFSEVGIHLAAADAPLIVRDWDVFDATAPGGKAGIGRWGLFMEPLVLTLGIPGDDMPNRYFQVVKYGTDGFPTPLMTVDQSGTVTASRFIGEASGLSGSITNLLSFARGYYEAPFAVYSSGRVTNLNADSVDGLHSTAFWQLGGNEHTYGWNSLGTWENQPLELMTYGTRTLRLEPDARGLGSGNLIGGNYYNAILQPGSGGCVIGGGGLWDYPNIISSNSSGVFLGAGSGNYVGPYAQDSVLAGGRWNQIAVTNMYSIIVGGQWNTIGANSSHSTLVGGQQNNIGANSRHSTLSGGVENNVGTNSTHSTIAGGGYNWIRDNVEAGTIPGGSMNTVGVGASFALAAGHQAKANHPGTFVWADSQNLDLNSTRTNEFLIRAQNGLALVSSVGIHLNGADAPLIVRDWDVFDGSAPNGKGGIGRWGLFMEPNNIALGMPANGSGSIRFGKYATDGTFTSLADVGQNGDFHIAGTYYPSSDRNVKQDLAPVNPSEVLAKVAALPVQTWSYTNSPTARHIGPMAQDFRAAFGLGEDEKHIATIDSDGVALAAIQGLNQKLEEQLKAKDAELSELRRRLEALEQRLTK